MKNKRGQVTLFIILGIVIVVIGVLIYLFLPKLNVTSEFDAKNPQAFLRSCVEEDLQTTVELISSQGGSLNPTNFYLHQGDKINFLCYTPEYYEFCSIQVPFLRNSIEEEINTEILSTVNTCFEELKENYQSKGYSVNSKSGELVTELLPGRILLTLLEYEMTVTKGDNTNKYDSFNVILNNNLYELISIAENIVEWEALFGDSLTLHYMMIYQDLIIEKPVKDTDATVYVIRDKNTGNKFQFASRSMIMPPGY